MPGFAGHLGSSINSHSVLGLCPGSRMPSGHYLVPAAGFQQGSSGDQWFVGRNNISDKLHECLIKELNINLLYTDCNKKELQFAWGCYLECSDAIQHTQAIDEARTWPADISPLSQIISSSMFLLAKLLGTPIISRFSSQLTQYLHFPT